MQDRVSLYPGRVKLVPVAGQENTYDMVRADSPTQEGTPLNKDSLLKDATAALYGLGADAVPNDVFSVIKSLIDSSNENANARAKIETGSYVGTGSKSNSITFSSLPKFVFINDCTSGNSNAIFISIVNNVAALRILADIPFYTTGTISGNTISWRVENYTAAEAMNKGGNTYYWIAVI